MPLTRALIARRLPESRHPPQPPPTASEALLRAGLRGALCGHRAGDPLRVFAYGSLMWERAVAPGAEARPARLRGFARRWSLRDIHNRGVPEAPGLTLGLEPEPDACCDGLLLTLPDAAALWPVWQHEMRPGFYRAAWVTAVPRLQGVPARALTFVADAAHPLHAGALPEATQARILARAVGPSGPDADYLLSAQETLRGAGLEDALLDRLCGQVGRLLACG
ncbi:gamma-glutamylcyclotransferase [Paracraurococcus lichenis]|uniref:glutathione-specific gamma-glutamylcyclotransferase n=1 Tax=Paracraurococcus lichenis TaxID=3064888 RepID=A0ABT9DZX4_9PROT|nr:gamma-glutamylcyclotransferase [Paracraurococcus sp. LOR1-02]MDO9709464.1 gamma-glutamylcyclotransferase [Paracraurococcus sp. LOR1-02]